MTSLVAMVDPPREESKAAVADAQEAHIRVRMVTGDDVVHRRGHRHAAGHPR